MFTKETQKYLDRWLPGNYRKLVSTRLQGDVHPTMITHVRRSKRWNERVAKEIIAVAKENEMAINEVNQLVKK